MMNSLRLLLLFLSTTLVHSFVVRPSSSCAISTTMRKDTVMSDMDLMCLENSADICSYYEECDIDDREALFNRFAEQTEIMAVKIAEMNGLVKHLKTGDHKHLGSEEVAIFRQKVLDLVSTELSL